MATTFLHAHAAHADGLQALARAISQLQRTAASHTTFKPTLGFLYFTDHHAAQAEALLDAVRATWPGVSVAGGVGIGVAASGIEYFDTPGIVLMLCDLPRTSFTLFSGRAPLARDDAWSALVHADPATHELPALIGELSERLQSRYLFGGLASSRTRTLTLADGVFEGGLSGVAFSADVALVSRVTQGCQPMGRPRRISSAERNLVLELDGQPALPVLLDELGVDLSDPARAVVALRRTLVGLTDEGDAALARGGQFGADTRVRHLIGVDPNRAAIAIADSAEVGSQLAFCTRDVEAARRDLVRICSEVREEAESSVAVAGNETLAAPRRIAGAIYVSCTGRGGAHFGAPSAELQTVRRALGDVPLVGFYAAGEIARRHLYGYTGVLTAFLD
ncbi:MAG: FIST C-terminal domain-containing protein [Burkholderiaceae bacterium]|nr:FIST C-terminal domain-containing protein [Burkholderiaceae bacterium]